MVQLEFDADTPAQALATRRPSVGYSQHEGAERAAWDDDKLELVGGTHPVVHPAAGSHANFFDEALYLGSSASEGVGCDDTRGPTFDIRPVVQTIPSDPAAARAAFPWIALRGPLGRAAARVLQRPDRPEPEAAVDGADHAGRRAGATAASRCPAAARSARARPTSSAAPSPRARTPCGGASTIRCPRSSALAVLLALIGLASARTTWRPAAPLRLARRRAWGQILAAAARMYGARLRLFLGIGVARRCRSRSS